MVAYTLMSRISVRMALLTNSFPASVCSLTTTCSHRMEFNSANTELMESLTYFADFVEIPMTSGRFICLGPGLKTATSMYLNFVPAASG